MLQPAAATPELIAGRYQLQRKLARGGMGEVFAATDLSTGAAIALKRMLPEAEQKRSHVINFMREYHALSELRHPRIIKVFDYGLDRNSPYFTMELLDGQDLGELSPLPYREACRYLRDVASSLALLHARRMLHRDLSPRNVRRTSDGSCKLLDFGAMVPFGIPPNLTGTPPCIAPEALQGGVLDQRTDLYALGALAYALLTGRHAYAVTQISALPSAWMKPPVHLKRIVRDVPDRLDALIALLMSIDPTRRPRSASEVIELLTAIAELEPDDSPAVARSFLVGSRLIGRDRECNILQTHLSKTLKGQGCALVLAGPAGSGRSRMLAEAAVIAQTCGLTAVRLVARAERGTASTLKRELVLGLRQVAPREAERASQALPLVRELVDSAARASAQNDNAHAQLLDQLVKYVRQIAGERALLITVDDLERADELSRALVAALLHQTATCPLALITTRDIRADSSPVGSPVTTLSLRELDHSETTRLVNSLFDDVPHVERVGEWLFAVSRGSPKLTLELAEHLVARGIVRHVAGAWVLPAEIVEAVPASTSEALLMRLHAASPIAMQLAQLLCLRRGGAQAECFLDLAQASSDSVFRGLDELVVLGVFESARDEYVFAQLELREALARSIDETQRKTLHARWADWLLARSPLEEDSQLEAGWHLVHTERALLGADLLAKIGPALVQRRVSMAGAIPAIERALELYEQHGRPLRDCLHLRALLVMSSYLFDYRLADRYAEATLDALYPFTGLADAERLSPVLGHTLSFLIGFSWAALRWCFRFGPRRGPNVLEALIFYCRSTMGLMGLRALIGGTREMRATLARMRMLERAPLPILSIVHNLAEAITFNGEGRWGDAKHSIERVLTRLDAGKALFTSEQEHCDLLTGALLLKGINSSYHEHSEALACAKRLEEIGTQLSAAAAMRVGMTYHLCRAEHAATRQYRQQLELHAIQHGNPWQVDWIAVPIEGLAGELWSDLPMLSRTVERLEQLAAERVGFSEMRDTIRIDYHYRRGDFAKVATLGITFIEQHAPGTFISWMQMYAVTALAYLELGKPEVARSICEPVFAPLTLDDHEYIVMILPLEAAYASTLAMLGERERAEAIFRARLDRQHVSTDHVRTFQVLQYRAQMLRLIDDRPELARALIQMRDAAQASGNAHLIALAESLVERQSSHRSPLPAANDQFAARLHLDADETSAEPMTRARRD